MGLLSKGAGSHWCTYQQILGAWRSLGTVKRSSNPSKSLISWKNKIVGTVFKFAVCSASKEVNERVKQSLCVENRLHLQIHTDKTHHFEISHKKEDLLCPCP